MFGGTAWTRTTIRRLTAFRNDLYTTDPNKKSRNRYAGSNYYLRTVSGLHLQTSQPAMVGVPDDTSK